MAATIRDIAKQANVSQTTVSLAFREGSRISSATRRKVLAVAEHLDYMPNLAARDLRHGRPRTLGLLVNDISNPFYALMARIVELKALDAGYQVIMTESQWDPAREVAGLRRMAEARVRGALVCFCEGTDEGREMLERFAVPYVALDAYPFGFKGAYVANDMACSGRLAGEHLAAVGCRHPALLIPGRERRGFSAFVRLRRGFSQALKRLAIPFGRKHVLHARLNIDEGLRGFERVRKALPEVDGIVCGNDLCALGVIEAADRAGVRVGADIAVMGIDDLDVSRMSRVSLTSIREPNASIAEEATRALIRAIEHDQKVSTRKTLKPELVIRDSTRRRRRRRRTT